MLIEDAIKGVKNELRVAMDRAAFLLIELCVS